MTIKEAIDKVDNLNPNQYSEEQKVEWLSRLDYLIYHDIILKHEYNPEEEEITYEPYSVSNMTQKLIAPFPYDELYVAFLQMKVDEANKETAQYNNSMTMYASYYDNYVKNYNREHMPINKDRFWMWRH